MLKLTIGLFMCGAVFSFKQLNRFIVLRNQNIVKAMEDEESSVLEKEKEKSEKGVVYNNKGGKDFSSNVFLGLNTDFIDVKVDDLVLREGLPDINSTKFDICKKFSVDPVGTDLLKDANFTILYIPIPSAFPQNLLESLCEFLKSYVINLDESRTIKQYIKKYNKSIKSFKVSKDKNILEALYNETEEVWRLLECILYNLYARSEELHKEGYDNFESFYKSLLSHYKFLQSEVYYDFRQSKNYYNYRDFLKYKYGHKQEYNFEYEDYLLKIHTIQEGIFSKYESFCEKLNSFEEFVKLFEDYLGDRIDMFRNIKAKIHGKLHEME